SLPQEAADDFHHEQAAPRVGKGAARRGSGGRHSGSSPGAWTLHPPRWTLRADGSSEFGGDIAGNGRPCQNFRNWPATISGTHRLDRKSTRLNSSHVAISYAVFC